MFPELPGGWLQDVIRSGSVKGVERRRLAFVNQLHKRPPDSAYEDLFQLALAAPVAPHGSNADKLGTVVAIVNWKTFQRILDGAEDRFRALGLSTGYAFMFANDANPVLAQKRSIRHSIQQGLEFSS